MDEEHTIRICHVFMLGDNHLWDSLFSFFSVSSFFSTPSLFVYKENTL